MILNLDPQVVNVTLATTVQKGHHVLILKMMPLVDSVQSVIIAQVELDHLKLVHLDTTVMQREIQPSLIVHCAVLVCNNIT